MSNELVSVIIPTKNSAKTLGTCLESIRNQTYRNIEIIIIDQESDDGTKEIAVSNGALYKEIPAPRFYTPPTKSRNIGAGLSSGVFLYHLDSDMQLSLRLIEEAVEKFAKDKSLGALIVHERDITNGFWSEAKALERRCYWGNRKIESARIVKKDVFGKAGKYDENISSGEDFDIHRRYEKITKTGFCTNVVFHNLGHLNFARLIKKKYSYGKTASKYFIKHSESGTALLKEQLKCFLNHKNLFFHSPITGIGTLILKVAEFTAGAFGYLAALTYDRK